MVKFESLPSQSPRPDILIKYEVPSLQYLFENRSDTKAEKNSEVMFLRLNFTLKQPELEIQDLSNEDTTTTTTTESTISSYETSSIVSTTKANDNDQIRTLTLKPNPKPWLQ